MNKFSTNSSLSTCYTHDLSSRESISNLKKMNKGTEGLRLIIAYEFSIGFGFRFLVSDSFLLLFYCPDGDSLKNHQQNNLLNFDSDNRHRVGSGLLFSASCH